MDQKDAFIARQAQFVPTANLLDLLDETIDALIRKGALAEAEQLQPLRSKLKAQATQENNI